MRGAVAAGSELTARAAAEVLEAGGNAVDAAVAAGAMSWVAEPALTSPCAGGFLLVHTPDGRSRLVDAFTAIPGRGLDAHRALREVESIEVAFDAQTRQTFHIGAASVAVPGVTAGLDAVHRRFGTMPWHELLA